MFVNLPQQNNVPAHHIDQLSELPYLYYVMQLKIRLVSNLITVLKVKQPLPSDDVLNALFDRLVVSF